MGLVISIILNLVATDLLAPICTTLLADLPGSGCTCEAVFGGFFDVTGMLDAQCNLSIGGAGTCGLSLSGEGSVLGFLFGGTGSLAVAAANCDIGGGNTASFQAGGTFSLESIEIDSCSASGTIGGNSLTCTCSNTGCESGNALSAVIDCDQAPGPPMDLFDQCVDFGDFFGTLTGALN